MILVRDLEYLCHLESEHPITLETLVEGLPSLGFKGGVIASTSDPHVWHFTGEPREDLELVNGNDAHWVHAEPLTVSMMSPVHVEARDFTFEPGAVYDLRVLGTSFNLSPDFAVLEGPHVFRGNIHHPWLRGTLSDAFIRARWERPKTVLSSRQPNLLFQEVGRT